MDHEFIIFSISEYLVSDSIHLNSESGVESMIYILDKLKNNILVDFNGPEEKEMLLNHLNKVIDIYKSQGQSSKHNIRYNLTGWSGHATFQIIYMIGWAPDPSQPQAKARGSAKLSLKDIDGAKAASVKGEEKEQNPMTTYTRTTLTKDDGDD